MSSQDIIAISSFNRRSFFVACMKCLTEVRGHSDWRVIVHDDASTEYDVHDLLGDYYPHAEAIRHERTLGCDKNNVQLLKAACGSGAKRVLMLDSDLILATDALEFADRVFSRTDGVLSLFNSNLHKVDDEFCPELVTKSTIGSAGVLWEVDFLKGLLAELDDAAHFDWKLSDAVRARGKKICVAKESRVQHIGIVGEHSNGLKGYDWGVGFRVETVAQGRAIAMIHGTQRRRPSKWQRLRRLFG